MLNKRESNTIKKEVIAYFLNYSHQFYRLAYSYVKNADDALDIVQESIVKGLSSLNSLKNSQHIKTWFYRILVNTSLDFLRKRRKIQSFDENILSPHSYEEKDNEKVLDLQAALDLLPPEYKTVIILRYFEDLKLEDISEITGINLNTVKTRLYTGLKKLKIQLDESEV